MALRNKCIEHKKWLQKLNRTRQPKTLRKLIHECSDDQVRTLQSLISAHLCPEQAISISDHRFKALKKSGLLRTIRKAFSPRRTLHSIDMTKMYLKKIVPVLRIFTKNCVT